MIRAAAFLLSLGALSQADPSVAFLDGRDEAAVLATADGTAATLTGAGGTRTVPTRSLASASLAPEPDTYGGPANLHLANGDRLRGAITGEGEVLLLEGPGIRGFRVPLSRVRAVRFGTLLAGVQERYAEALAEETVRGKDVVIIQRGSNPFPIAARVLSVDAQSLKVRVGDEQRDLPLAKVYGFVRSPDRGGPAEQEGLAVRVHLGRDSRLTLPLERITAEAVLGGGAQIDRALVTRIEFAGDHVANLSDLEPIEVEEVALFGKAAPWQRDGMVFGGPLRLGGRAFERGLGVHAKSRLEYALGRRWRTFFVRCGIDDAAGREGAARFRVFGDGKLLAEVARRRGEVPAPLVLDVQGVERLVLEAAPGESYTSDFCDWAEARVFKESPG